MKSWGKKSLLSVEEESVEKKRSGFKGGSEILSFFPLRILGLFLGEEYWSAVPFSPALSPLCSLLIVAGLEEVVCLFQPRNPSW